MHNFDDLIQIRINSAPHSEICVILDSARPLLGFSSLDYDSAYTNLYAPNSIVEIERKGTLCFDSEEKYKVWLKIKEKENEKT